MDLTPQLPQLLDLMREAAACCQSVAEDFVHDDHHDKHDASPVTVADYASQALILHHLARLFPGVCVVAEEDGDALRERPALCERVACFLRPRIPGICASDVPNLLDQGNGTTNATAGFWTLDPIDGTKGYLRGGQYAVALAYVEGGAPKLGLLACPRLPGGEGEPGALFVGGPDLPSFSLTQDGHRRQAIRVTPGTCRSHARLCESVESAHTAHDRSARLIERLGLSTDVLRLDSQAKYAVVARGDAALYLRLPVKKGYVEKIWDHAAGVAVIQGAGGKVSDLDGKPLDFGLGATLCANRGVLATNGAWHEEVLDALDAVTPKATP